jgi:hypothetical protein
MPIMTSSDIFHETLKKYFSGACSQAHPDEKPPPSQEQVLQARVLQAWVLQRRDPQAQVPQAQVMQAQAQPGNDWDNAIEISDDSDDETSMYNPSPSSRSCVTSGVDRRRRPQASQIGRSRARGQVPSSYIFVGWLRSQSHREVNKRQVVTAGIDSIGRFYFRARTYNYKKEKLPEDLRVPGLRAVFYPEVDFYISFAERTEDQVRSQVTEILRLPEHLRPPIMRML